MTQAIASKYTHRDMMRHAISCLLIGFSIFRFSKIIFWLNVCVRRPFNGIQKYTFTVNIDEFEYAQQHTELLAILFTKKNEKLVVYLKLFCVERYTKKKRNEPNAQTHAVQIRWKKYTLDDAQMKRRYRSKWKIGAKKKIYWTNPRFWVTVDEITNVVGWQRHIVYTKAGTEKINKCNTRNIVRDWISTLSQFVTDNAFSFWLYEYINQLTLGLL